MKQNQPLLKIQKKRAFIIDKIREFFKNKGFLEVQTPIFVRLPGMEPYLNPLSYEFSDEKNQKHKGYVITSPEYSLKKLLSRGFPKIFEMTKVFRQNESFGGIHNPEFTMIEWYRPNSNYRKIMSDTEELVCCLAKALHTRATPKAASFAGGFGKAGVATKAESAGQEKNWITYDGREIDLSRPWPKISVKQAFKKYAGVNLDKAKTLKDFKKQATTPLPRNANWDDIFYAIFLNQIEPNFPKNRPIIVYDYPLPQASLAKRKTTFRLPSTELRINRSGQESFYAERFELYIGGLEIANCFSELVDWKEQEKRLKQERRMRQELGKEVYDIDKDFIDALKSHMPETGGIALGVDRLQMLLLDIKDINDLLLFPAKDIFR